MRKKTLSLAALVTLSLACTLFSAPPIEPAPLTATFPLTQTPLPTPFLPSSSERSLIAQKNPVALITEQNGTLTLLDTDGYTILQLDVQGIPDTVGKNAHIASIYPDDLNLIPILYYSHEQNNSLVFSQKGMLTTMLSTPNFSGMVGAPGEPIIAYTTTTYFGNMLRSSLYAGAIPSLPGSTPFYTEDNAEGWTLVALAVDTSAGEPRGVWYSYRPWGIGGDIIFERRRTLFYLDLLRGEIVQYLGMDVNPSALSADRSWVAYTQADAGKTSTGSIAIRNLHTGEEYRFPLQDVVDARGAGAASFSPNNQYIAWVEGNGQMQAEFFDFHSGIRIGDLKGNLLAEFSDQDFAQAAGFDVIQRVEPVGWLDDQTLVVSVYERSSAEATQLKISLSDGHISFLAQGSFIGFFYPR